MTLHYDTDGITVHAGDCLDVLRELPDASVDAVVTDPPYGLEFMGKEWDAPWKSDRLWTDAKVSKPEGRVGSDGVKRNKTAPVSANTPSPSFRAGLPFQQWCQAWATECLRVLKPGGHILAFGGTRTSHRLACAIEDAGFEIRDSIAWLYGSGFPKSLDVSKAIDKAAGHWRGQAGAVESDNDAMGGPNYERTDKGDPITDDARTWQGWGTALKPAHEPVVVARRPLSGTVAANVLAHGTGALNIDASRIGDSGATRKEPSADKSRTDSVGGYLNAQAGEPIAAGRWPANVILDEDQAAALDTMSGHQRDGVVTSERRFAGWEKSGDLETSGQTYGGEGGASRFFYTAKAAADERVRVDSVSHPTVKPLALMRWLIRLVTPPGGIVLEPFAGSGTTVEACILEGFRCVAIEREADYLPLIMQRIHRRRDPVQAVKGSGTDGGLFDLLNEETA